MVDAALASTASPSMSPSSKCRVSLHAVASAQGPRISALKYGLRLSTRRCSGYSCR